MYLLSVGIISHHTELLTFKRVTEVAEMLISERELLDLEKLGEELGEPTAEHLKKFSSHYRKPGDEVVFSILNAWRLKTDRPTVTMLAKILEKSNLAKEAYKLDPSRKYLYS